MYGEEASKRREEVDGESSNGEGGLNGFVYYVFEYPEGLGCPRICCAVSFILILGA